MASTFSPEAGGEPKKNAKIQVVLDGFSAPLTAGNFVKLVVDGAYNGAKLSFTDQAVLTDNGLDKNSGYSVPLEIMPSGQFEPLYRTTLSVQDGELPVLPLSVYGAVAMAHSEVSEDFSAPYQFFFYLYDKRNAGLGGLSFDEGQFSVFGYTTAGERNSFTDKKWEGSSFFIFIALVMDQPDFLGAGWCPCVGDLCKSFLLPQLLAFDIVKLACSGINLFCSSFPTKLLMT
ncbi:hypothetical protein NC653_004761 [Populus alba x Populus x berolinensis]|uniref:PPIase cyclophilin-type domain-containing protein n=1 Tax=Populus alba x Populus x berolinensis TaxID=444605 RepID=A0AAD6RUT6_9ROSI|nr:hypothetical protein NC653_004761 [Populus alba x Populus x berolinensis]